MSGNIGLGGNTISGGPVRATAFTATSDQRQHDHNRHRHANARLVPPASVAISRLAAALTRAGAFATRSRQRRSPTALCLPGRTRSPASTAQTWSAVNQFNSGDLKLAGATSGLLTVNAAATAGNNTLTFPGATFDFSGSGGAGQYVKQLTSGGAFSVAAIASGDLPLANNAAIGGMRGDTATISCVGGSAQLSARRRPRSRT